MNQTTDESFTFPSTAATTESSGGVGDPLTQVIRQGARTLLAQAVEAEVAAWIDQHAHITDEQGRRQVVRNGHRTPRSIITGVGPIEVTAPRVHDKRPASNGQEHFSSAILPPYLRKARAIEELIPWLYLKGVSTGDFGQALQALLGPNCPRSSPGSVRPRWYGSSKPGRVSIVTGINATCLTSVTSTSGPMAYISTSAWRKIAPVFSC